MNPEFQEILCSFRKFLEQQDVPDKIVWVLPEHTIYCGGKKWKIFENEGISDDDINSKYQSARENSLGVRFCVLCSDTETSYCYLYVPVDEHDAEYKLLANGCVKMSVPSDMPKGSITLRGFRAICWQLRESIKFKKWKAMAFRIG